jgi:hypothetical protein
MAIITETRPTIDLVASNPYSSTDLPRFGQLVETATDAFVKELTDFFDYTNSDGLRKIKELPNIQKFSFGSQQNNAGLETVVNLIISYADTLGSFPMISISSSSVRERKMGLGSNYAAKVQRPIGIVATNSGPFDLTTIMGDPTITIVTTPEIGTLQSSVISFSTSLFSDPHNVTVDDLVRVINKTQALYYTCYNAGGYFAIEAGGIAAPYVNNSIELTAGNSQLLALLGYTVGDSASYSDTGNPLKNRYSVAADMVINIDVVCGSINTRAELADLVFSFFAYYMQNKAFQLYGRSFFTSAIDTEWWHLSLKNQFAWGGEVNKLRPGGEQYDYIFAVRGTVPIFIEDFIDKEIVDAENLVMVERENVVESIAVLDSDIIGDYFGNNYRK